MRQVTIRSFDREIKAGDEQTRASLSFTNESEVGGTPFAGELPVPSLHRADITWR